MNLHFSIHPSPCIGACQPTPLAGTTERLSRGGVSLAVMLTPAEAFGGAFGTSVTGIVRYDMRFWFHRERNREVASHPRLVRVALEKAEHAEDKTALALEHWRKAIADGRITRTEALRGLKLQSDAHDAAHDVVQATCRADVVELAAVSILSGILNPSIQEQLDDVGVVIDWPGLPAA